MSRKGRKSITPPCMGAGASPRRRIAGPPYCASAGAAAASSANARESFKVYSSAPPLRLAAMGANQSLTRVFQACQVTLVSFQKYRAGRNRNETAHKDAAIRTANVRTGEVIRLSGDPPGSHQSAAARV